jgi:hypothetical protein
LKSFYDQNYLPFSVYFYLCNFFSKGIIFLIRVLVSEITTGETYKSGHYGRGLYIVSFMQT